jgi:hypothetical protein
VAAAAGVDFDFLAFLAGGGDDILGALGLVNCAWFICCLCLWNAFSTLVGLGRVSFVISLMFMSLIFIFCVR